MSDPAPDPGTVVSHEQDGRVLSGVGVSADQLAETMDRHAPPDPAPAASQPGSPGAPSAAAPETPAAPDPTAAPQTRGKARFAELAAQRDAERQKREAAERERDELKARLTQPQAAPEAPARPVERPVEPEPARGTRPEPSEEEIGAKYKSYAEFTKDQALWLWEQQQAQLQTVVRQSIEADHAARTYQEHIEATRVKGRQAYADFDAVLQQGPGGQVQMPMDRIRAIYAAPQSEHLQYAIMKDAGLAQHLAQLDPIGFGVALARLVAQVQPAEAGRPAAGTPGPPAPYQPVGAGTRTTVPSSSDLASKGYDFDKSGYRERRAAERGLKPRR